MILPVKLCWNFSSQVLIATTMAATNGDQAMFGGGFPTSRRQTSPSRQKMYATLSRRRATSSSATRVWFQQGFAVCNPTREALLELTPILPHEENLIQGMRALLTFERTELHRIIEVDADHHL
jgi:hypothetical protein